MQSNCALAGLKSICRSSKVARKLIIVRNLVKLFLIMLFLELHSSFIFLRVTTVSYSQYYVGMHRNHKMQFRPEPELGTKFFKWITNYMINGRGGK